MPQLDKCCAYYLCKLANNLTKIRQHFPYFLYFIPIQQQPKLSTTIPTTHIIQQIILNSLPQNSSVFSNHSNKTTTHRPIIRFIIRNTSTLLYSSFGVYTHNHINICITPKQNFQQLTLIKTAQTQI